MSLRTDGRRPKKRILTVRHEHKELIISKVRETLRGNISKPEVFHENDVEDWVAYDIEKNTDLWSFERDTPQTIMPVRPPAFLGSSTSVRFPILPNSHTPRIRIKGRAIKVAKYQPAKSGRYGTIERHDGYKGTFNLDNTTEPESKEVIPICHCLRNFPCLKCRGKRARGNSKPTTACFKCKEMGHWVSDCTKKSVPPYGSCFRCGDVTYWIRDYPETPATGANRIRHE